MKGIVGVIALPAPPVMASAVVLLIAVLTLGAGGHADVREGFTAYNKGDFVSAREAWLPLAKNGDAEAQYNLVARHRGFDGLF